MLSVRIMQSQGFEVEALNIRTLYSCCQAAAAQSAGALGARLTVLSVGDDYLDVIRNPLYGYGRGVNPCIDCRIHMCRMARRFMEEVGACVVVTGEIAGQRPMSQKKHHLEVIARRSGLEGRLLRPLSARLLAPTALEQAGIVDREHLYNFHGRSRRDLIELARQLSLPELPTPSTGCALTEPSFAPRVRDLMRYDLQANRWDFELLSYGRHFRFDPKTKIVVGRDAADNAALRRFAARKDAPETALLTPEDFVGPDALVVGRWTAQTRDFAGAMMLRYARRDAPGRVRLHVSGLQTVAAVSCCAIAESAAAL